MGPVVTSSVLVPACREEVDSADVRLVRCAHTASRTGVHITIPHFSEVASGRSPGAVSPWMVTIECTAPDAAPHPAGALRHREAINQQQHSLSCTCTLFKIVREPAQDYTLLRDGHEENSVFDLEAQRKSSASISRLLGLAKDETGVRAPQKP